MADMPDFASLPCYRREGSGEVLPARRDNLHLAILFLFLTVGVDSFPPSPLPGFSRLVRSV